ncbi:MAG TPA: hypothetical protein VNP92_19795 [Actinophytocola sp.]|nr:hypothetical protein [Actinophytocola sp.]
MRTIAPGGCYPEDWPTPPHCWPPLQPAPEPDPASLDATVDWLTYPHHELYQMVHNGLDLTGAMEVSAQWARLGGELAEMGAELGKIVNAAATAWEGEAADLAKDALASLTQWATDAGGLAARVSGCVTIEVDNATNARDEMPAPPYPIIDLPTHQQGPHSPVPPTASAFTSSDFTGAAAITADPAGPINHEKAMHAQAARTMERFQSSSREVYGTVPQFSPPMAGAQLFTGGPVEPTPPVPPVPPAPPAPVPGPPRVPSGGGPAPGGGAPGGGSAGGGTGSRVGTPAATPGPATGAGEPAARPAAASAGTPGRTGGQPGVGGGMPMGGGGSRGAEDAERKSAAYLKEDEDIWGGNDPMVPPVLGVDGRRA